MPILLTVCGVATFTGASYIGALSFEALASDSRNRAAAWSYVWADLLGLSVAICAMLTALHSIIAAWLP